MQGSLEEKFTAFAKTLKGAECIDDLTLTHEQNARQRADFFFNSREIIAEIKSLKTDTEGKIEAILEPYRDTQEFPHFYGEQDLRKVLEFLPNKDELNRRIFNAVTDSIEGLVEKANRQIRTTKESFNLPLAGGLLIILNDVVDILSPNVLVRRVRNAFHKRTSAGEVRFPHVTYVWTISTAHYVNLSPTLKSMPIIGIPSGFPDHTGVEPFAASLSQQWAEYDGSPLIKSDPDNFFKFDFKTFSNDIKSRLPMPRHEHWKRQYKQSPYLRSLSKEELFDFGLQVMAKTFRHFSVKAKRKPSEEIMFDVGTKFTHFIEEMNYRAIDMREFEPKLKSLNDNFHIATRERKTTSKTYKNKIGRGAPCPCQSGRTYNRCCGKERW